MILARPSATTWGFGLYCFTEFPAATSHLGFVSPVTALWTTFAYDIVENLGTVGIVLFALEFPRAFDLAWRRRIRRALPAIFVLVSAMTPYPDIANLVLGIGATFENRVLQIVFGVIWGLAIFILNDTYRRVAPIERERLRWVMIGFGFGLVTNYIGNTIIFSSMIAVAVPHWVLNVLVSLNVLLPLTVAYAIVRHRVLDINFVLGRALVYAALTTVLAGLFELFDWLFGTVLADFRLSRFFEAGLAIGVAFIFDALHERTKSGIDGVFFRRRRAAEACISRLAHDLPSARTERAIADGLIEEPASAFTLTSAALFRQVDGRGFVRIAARGWSDENCSVLDDTDLLLLSLRADTRSVRLADFHWRRTDLPPGARTPVVAVPMHSRAELKGVLLYGGHPDGGDVDPGELEQLNGLAHAGSAAFDQLESDRLRTEASTQSGTIAELQVRLDELRRQQLGPRTIGEAST